MTNPDTTLDFDNVYPEDNEDKEEDFSNADIENYGL